MTDLTKYYIDLSKLSEEQIKELAFVMQRTKNLHDKAFDFMSKGKTFDRFICLAQTDSKEWTLWNLTAVFDKTELTYHEFIKLFEGGEGENKVKIAFGLEAQGHIPVIEAELKRWNDSFNADYPDHKTKDTMTYSKDVWESIGKKIGWCPFTASLAYFEWLKNNQ